MNYRIMFNVRIVAFWIFHLLVLVSPFSVNADGTTAKASLVSTPFFESYQPEVSVSGNVIVGVMTSLNGEALVSNSLSINPPDNQSGKVCLRAASSDGIYLSKNQYQLPVDSNGPVELPYPTSLQKVVKKYRQGEIALSATTGDCDSGSSEYFTVSPATPAEHNRVFIYLNSFGATDVFFQASFQSDKGATETEILPCKYIHEGRRTAFDFYCEVAELKGNKLADITIIRERFGREQPSVELKIIGMNP